jgi:polyhydroxyalkanoate synthesis regulator phasin
MSNSADDSGVQSVYNFWLGLIPQFFNQLGAGASSGANPAAAPIPGLLFPADQVARAATMTQQALQGIAQAYTPMLQAAGAPGLLGQWAAAMPLFMGAGGKAQSAGGAAPAAQNMFAPWAAAMPFLSGAQTPTGPATAATAAAHNMFNPWAAAMAMFPAAQSGNAAKGAAAIPAPWSALFPFAAGAQTAQPAAGDAGPTMANLGLLPFQTMQQAWRDIGTQMAGASTQGHASTFDRTFGALTDALGFGPMRKLQSAWQDLLAATYAQNEARASYALLVQSAFAVGLEGLLQRLAEMAEKGERVDSVFALLRLWAVNAEEAVHKVLQSPDGMTATANVARAGLGYRRKIQHMASIIADGLDLATRRDLDEAYREIHELKREVRKLRPLARVSAEPRKPRARATKKGRT